MKLYEKENYEIISYLFRVAALLNPKTVDHDTTGKTKYIKKCFDLGINPVSYFVKNLENKELKLRFHGLGAESVKAISFPLEVNPVSATKGSLWCPF
jgi:hypothetical protein